MLKFNKILFALILCELTLNGLAQIPVWVLGNSQQTSTGSFYSLGSGNLKFFNVNFSGPSPVFTTRTLGTSVNSIKSIGTQDVINNAVDSVGNVLFYLFSASQTPYNFSSSPIDTVYFVAKSPTTGLDEVFGKVVAESRISSVIEHGLCKKPGTLDQYYFVYKTRSGSASLDDVRYVTINLSTKTVSSPVNLKNNENNSEGFAITPYDCASGKQWVYTATLLTGGNLKVWKYEVTSLGISLPILAYTINISSNTSVSVIGGIEVSPQGDKLAVCNYNAVDDPNKELIIFDLDISTGNLSAERWYKNPLYPLVACEFSNDGSQIYMLQSGSGSFPSKLYHRPVLTTGSYTLTSSDALPLTLNAPLALERAANGKIYGVVGPNDDNFYFIDNIDSSSPIVGYTSATFYGSFRIGDGLPDLTDEINSVSSLTISGDTSICIGDSILLVASGASSFIWSGGITASNDSIIVSPSINTTYIVSSSSSCTISDTFSINVYPQPVISVSPNDSICSGQTISLSVSGSATAYSWSGGVSSSDSIIYVSPTSTTNYFVIGSNTSCSSLPDTVTVTVVTNPNVNIIGQTSICLGDSTTLSVSSPFPIQWSGGSSSTLSSITVSPLVNTQFIATATNTFCSDSDTVNVLVSPYQQANFTYEQDMCSGEFLFSSNSGPFSFDWSLGDSAAFGQSVYFAFADTGFFQIQLIVNAGSQCADTLVQQVHNQIFWNPNEPFIPNIFTPNNDGINDKFVIKGLCNYDKLVIFDRWGVKIFETDNPQFDFWDGKFKNENAVQGVYYYIFTYKGSEMLKGHLTLSR